MKIIKIEALLMDNNEIIFMGKSLGWIREDGTLSGTDTKIDYEIVKEF